MCKNNVISGVLLVVLVGSAVALPKLEPFDLIFDRACYHHIQKYNSAGYSETLRRLSHRGTRALILAFASVKEETICNDFSALFDFEWVRRVHCDTRDSSWSAWSLHLHRKAKLKGASEPSRSLQELAAKGDMEAVKSMIDQGADVNGREDGFKRTALHRAAMSGQKDVSKLLIDNGARLDVKDVWPGVTALGYAVEKGHKDIAELLIAHGANVNAKRDYPAGDTPLHSAVRTGHKEIVELLIAKGADEEAKNNNGLSPIDMAVSKGHGQIGELLQAKAAETSIHWAAILGSLAKVKAFIESGTDVNVKDKSHQTPLHEAISNEHKDLAKFLIEQGADVNAKGKGGYTPLYSAIWNGDANMVELLISKGADVNYSPEKDYPPLHYAVWMENTDIARVLLDHGANSDAKDQDGRTAFRYTVDAANREMVELFVAKGANVNAKAQNNSTPLHQAAMSVHKDVAEILLANGADATIKDGRGRTALSWALERGHTEIVELLKPGFLDTKPGLILTGPTESYTQYGNYPRFGDVNGDGYEDLLVAGASRYNNNQGRVYLYYGGTDMDGIADIILTGENSGDDYKTGENPGDYFGEDAYLADVNGDAYADVVTGAFGYNNLQGRVYIYYGGPDMDENPDLILNGEPGTHGAFGLSITAGDVNNDGYDDVVVTASSFKNKTGRVYLFYGGDPMDTTVDLTFDGENENDRFGRDINNPKMIGDVNGDGYGDLLISTRTWNFWEGVSGQGRAYLYYGGPGTSMDSTCDKIFTGENERDDFGVSGCIFDIDNDGFDDVIIGARGYNNARGRVYLYWGGKDMDTIADKTFDGEGGCFGCGLDAGYVNGDKYGDIIVAAPYYSGKPWSGKAYLFYGDAKASINTICDKTFTLPTDTNNWTQHVALGDLNNDNYPEVAIGGCMYNNGQGRVWIYFNKPPSSK